MEKLSTVDSVYEVMGCEVSSLTGSKFLIPRTKRTIYEVSDRFVLLKRSNSGYADFFLAFFTQFVTAGYEDKLHYFRGQ